MESSGYLALEVPSLTDPFPLSQSACVELSGAFWIKLIFSADCSKHTSGRSPDRARGSSKWTSGLGEELAGQGRSAPSRGSANMWQHVRKDIRDLPAARVHRAEPSRPRASPKEVAGAPGARRRRAWGRNWAASALRPHCSRRPALAPTGWYLRNGLHSVARETRPPVTAAPTPGPPTPTTPGSDALVGPLCHMHTSFYIPSRGAAGGGGR